MYTHIYIISSVSTQSQTIVVIICARVQTSSWEWFDHLFSLPAFDRHFTDPTNFEMPTHPNPDAELPFILEEETCVAIGSETSQSSSTLTLTFILWCMSTIHSILLLTSFNMLQRVPDYPNTDYPNSRLSEQTNEMKLSSCLVHVLFCSFAENWGP